MKNIKNNKKESINTLIEKMINVMRGAASITDVFINSNEYIDQFFKNEIFLVYIREGDVLNCIIRRSLMNFEVLKELKFDQEEQQIFFKLNKAISADENEIYNKLLEKFKIDKNYKYVFSPVINISNFLGFIIIGRKRIFSNKEKDILFYISSIIAPAFLLSANLKTLGDNQKFSDALTIISNAIVDKNNLEDTLKIIVNVVAEVMDYKICSIMLYNEEKQELIIKATQSLSQEYKSKPNLKIGQSLSGRAILEKRPIFSEDVTKDPNYKYPEIAKRENLKSMLAVPMIIKDKIIGVINVYTQQTHFFSENEKKLLITVANLSAIAIQNAQLEEEAIKAKNALESRKIIERAKGILMKMKNLSEDEAYNAMRKKAMDLCKPLKEIAEAIILSCEIESQSEAKTSLKKNNKNSDAMEYQIKKMEER